MTAGLVAVGSIVLGGSAQAAAVTQADSSGQITAPSDGQVVSSPSVTVSARTGLMQLSMGLYVEGPSTPTQKVAEGGANQTISGTFDAGNAPNGTFTVTLKGGITGTQYANSTFKLRRPAETPGNVNASLQGAKKVLVSWSKGSEPDLQSYEVSNTQSGVVGRLPADSVCDGSSCRATIAVPAKAAGQKVGFTVKAFRGDGDGGSMGSEQSGAAYVTVPAPAAARPKKETAKTRETPKETRNVDPLPTLPAKKQIQPTSKPATDKPTTSKLPAIPDTDSDGNLPIPTADDRGETGGLTPEGTENGTDTAPVQAGGVKAQSNESPIGNIGQYGLYVAGGLLLLLLGAHAGAWARRRALAAEGGPRPSASNAATAASAVVAGSEADGAAVGAVRGDDDSAPVTATPPRRRPAVILAVAKTRVPDQAHAAKPSSADRPGGQGLSSLDRPGGQGLSSLDRPGGQEPALAGRPRGQEPALAEDPDVRGPVSVSGADAGGPSPAHDLEMRRATSAGGPGDGGADGRLDDEEPGSAGRSRAPGAAAVDGPGETSAADRRRAHGRSAAEASRLQAFSPPILLDHAHNGTPAAALPLGAGEVRPTDGRAGEPGGVKEGHVVRQEPVRIALPSSAVTDVPESSASVARPAIRIEDRWDDYLPPSPRSMEDSGFWERPQPGAADFWAADDADVDGYEDDDDKRAYAGRRNKGGHS
ncbi:hypothetical protein [Nonomuraea sp. NPDC049480]|uniref:hypothetical protein n=1 Tax=Nonomuraea sp. NPDC049480 TaxID=3364353 RepID=UPI0037924021